LQHEKEETDRKFARMKEHDEQLRELKAENKRLEEKITRLCETPFIGEANDQLDSKLRYDQLLEEREELKRDVEHLTEAVHTHYSALMGMKNDQVKLREEKEEIERKYNDLHERFKSNDDKHQLLQQQLKLYSGEDGVQVEDLERALTVVRRRGEAASRLDFLEDPDNNELGQVTIPVLKRKLQDVQVMNLNLAKDVERLEGMLNLQHSINKDLHKELELLTHKRDKDKRGMI
jgi:predicted nuclease with TOPRIM domain